MSTKQRNPFLAAFLSFVVSGLGQMYNGQLVRGIVFWFITLLSSIFILVRFPRSYGEFNFVLWAKFILAAVIIINAFWVARSKREVQIKGYHRWYYYLIVLIIHLAISLYVSSYTLNSLPYTINTIQSPAMEPTLFLGDRFVIDMNAYKESKPRRGDIVLLRYLQADSLSVGRVIGRPGDKIASMSGVIYINGKTINEPYVQGRTEESFGPIVLPHDQYFIMGDRRSFSYDSRNRGLVDGNNIYGKYLYKINFLSSH